MLLGLKILNLQNPKDAKDCFNKVLPNGVAAINLVRYIDEDGNVEHAALSTASKKDDVKEFLAQIRAGPMWTVFGLEGDSLRNSNEAKKYLPEYLVNIENKFREAFVQMNLDVIGLFVFIYIIHSSLHTVVVIYYIYI